MSILIKGIDLNTPKKIVIYPSGNVDEYVLNELIQTDYKAIQIDRPHGRLGDLDVLLEESLKEGAYNYVDSWQIAEQPTILESED